MSGPLIRVNQGGSRRQEKKQDYKDFWIKMYPIVALVVEASFLNGATDMRNPTSLEVRARIDTAKKIVDEMRIDCHFSIPRIRDNLALVLRSRLAGIHVDLETLGRRGTW